VFVLFHFQSPGRVEKFRDSSARYIYFSKSTFSILRFATNDQALNEIVPLIFLAKEKA